MQQSLVDLARNMNENNESFGGDEAEVRRRRDIVHVALAEA